MSDGKGRGHAMDWRTRAGNCFTIGLPTGGTDVLRQVWQHGGQAVALVVNTHGQGDRNAALIAAAPQLLAACEAVNAAMTQHSVALPPALMAAADACRTAAAAASVGSG